MKYCLVIPCYNEAQRLDLPQFTDFLLKNTFADFLFVNDGSSDNTAQLLADFQSKHTGRVNVLSLEKNSGKAEAVRQGMLAVKGQYDYIGYWDADLAVPLSELRQMDAKLTAHPELYCLLASRVKLLGYDIVRKPLRHYLGRIFATAASILLKMPVYDTQCGAKLFKSELQTVLFQEKFRVRWIFDVEILLRFKQWYLNERLDGKIENYINEMPLAHWYDIGGSKVKPMHFVQAFGDFLRLWPLRKNIKE